MSDCIIFDAHCDTVSELLNRGEVLSENTLCTDMRRMSKYLCYTQVFAAFISPKYADSPMRRAEELIAHFYRETAQNGIDVCKSYSDWAASPAKVRAFLSIEGGECIRNLSDVKHLYDLGVRMIAPTWNFRNKIACGVSEEKDTGLSSFGKSVISEMNRLGIIVDVSHLSPKSFWDVAEISTRPICASHSNSKTVTNHIRNLSDRQFLQIVRSGGICGINFYPPFLGEDISCAIDHINHFLSLGGENHIGIGSDFDGTDRLPTKMNGSEDMDNFIKSLPYSTELRKKIAYKNFLRFIRSQL